MQYVLIIHEVENYLAWETIFDNAATIKKDAEERFGKRPVSQSTTMQRSMRDQLLVRLD